MSEAAPGTMRATPFYCPYCGEQELRPTSEARTWYCKVCDRLFRLEFKQIGNPEAVPPPR